jgi:hypothetical protein
MTLVGGLVFNKKKGGGFIADVEETSYAGGSERKADIVEKIYGLAPEGKPSYFAGFSGPSPFITQIVERVKSSIPEVKLSSSKQLESLIQNSYKTIKRKIFEDGILERYQVSLDDYKRGNLDDRIMRNILSMIDNPRGLSVGGLIGGRLSHEEDFGLSEIHYPGLMLPVTNYSSVGSGSDGYNLEVSGYLHGMTTEERKDIPLTLGSRILLEGLNSSLRNTGVGTTGKSPGQMIIVYNDKVVDVDRKRLNMLQSSLDLEKRGILEKDYVNKIIADTVETNMEPEEILKKIQTKITPEDMFRISLLESKLT